MVTQNPEAVLQRVNLQLSGLLRQNALPLQGGGMASLQDPLWVWGLLGGKNVGKSSLINALAGSDIVATSGVAGEGTFQPAAYLAEDDLDVLQSRFAPLPEIAVHYVPTAPATMRQLVLVDLPDFDSLFEQHLDQVRRISRVLDGIIWVTTPKKVADLRGIQEIQQVLKDRINFFYVVNKMDWLLGQSDRPAKEELDRVRAALHAQIAACQATDGAERSFLISAKYRGAESILETIAHNRKLPSARLLADARLHEAAGAMEHDFRALAEALTTAPTAEAAQANKQANLTYQIGRQTKHLLDYYQPQPLLGRLDGSARFGHIKEQVERSFSSTYVDQVIDRLNSHQNLFVAWSAELFKRRIAHWSLLGVIAWPLTLLGSLIRGLHAAGPEPGDTSKEAFFRFDGIGLQERSEAVLAGVKNILMRLDQRVDLELPEAQELARQFRQDALSATEDYRRGCLAPYLQKKPTAIGRFGRWLLPVVVLLWFPLLQPLLAAGLSMFRAGWSWDTEAVLLVVQSLSAGHMLGGLLASMLILSVLVAAVYSTAARDTYRALDRLRSTSLDSVPEALIESLAAAVHRPIDQFRNQIADSVATLEQCLDGPPSEPGGA